MTDLPSSELSSKPNMPCGHPISAVVAGNEGTHYCRECVAACSPDDYEIGRDEAGDGEQMGAEAERARIREAVEAIPNVIDADVEHRAHVQQGIEIMRGRVLAAIEGGQETP